jgi:ABC-type transport system involved in multi-copper enzyme maturation permease subunit
MAATIFFASIFSRKVISAGLSATFVLGSYILNIIGEGVEPGTIGDVLARFSVWRYFETQGVVQNGFNYTYVTGLLVLAVVLVGLSTFAFERRDVA